MIFIGDIHGQFQIFLDLLKSKKYQSETLIQVGDFGVGFYPIDQEYHHLNKINSWLIKNNNFLYVIRGNHDNPNYFTESPFQLSNIQFLNDFDVLTIEDKTILFVGGAISIDRKMRREGVDYWKDEELPHIIPDISQIYDGTSIDIVCTHNCPTYTWPTELSPIIHKFVTYDKTLIRDLIDERKRLDLLYEKIKDFNGYDPKRWVYGHMHKTIQTMFGNTTFQCCGINHFYELLD